MTKRNGKWYSTAGCRNANAKFTAEDIKMIRWFYAHSGALPDKETRIAIAKKYKCHPYTIYRIVTKNPKWRRYQNVT